MPIISGKCPNCHAKIELYSTHAFGVCSYCGKRYLTEQALSEKESSGTSEIKKTDSGAAVKSPDSPTAVSSAPNGAIGISDITAKPPVEYASGNVVYRENESVPEPAQDYFLSGSSFLALGDFEKAAQQFLQAAKLSPGNPKYWLYLLCAATDKFTRLYRLCGDSETVKVGTRRIYCSKVYKNFLSTAENDDFIFVKGQFGVDLSPESGEVWENILTYVIRKKNLPFGLLRASEIAVFAFGKLSALAPEKAEIYRDALCRRLNPEKDGVLEINTLCFYPEPVNGVFSAYENADTVEFASDNMTGSEKYKAFLLKNSVETIGIHFPFEQLISDSDVEKIPDKLICFCGKLRKVTLSEKVTSVGKSAFEGCINLSVVENTENLREISDRAFFGTSIRVLDIPGSVRKLGKEILGCGPKASEQCEIEKYLIKLDASLAAKSKGFNNVGAHKCGYIVRKKGKLRLCYPMKSVKGSYKPVSEREKMIFKALAYTSIDKEDIELVKSESKLQKITDKLKSLFRPKE